jgi:MFS family permease
MTRNFLLLFFGAMFFNMNYTLYFLVPFYLELRGMSESFYGAVAGTFGLATFVSVMLLGHLGDTWQRKWSVLIYMAVSMVGNLIAVLAIRGAPEWYFAVRALHGVTAGLGFPLIYAWSVDLGPPERRVEVLAYMGVGFFFATYLGPFVGELILSWQPDPNNPDAYLAVFQSTLVIGLISMLLLLLADRSTAPPTGHLAWSGITSVLFRKATAMQLLTVLIFGGGFGIFFAFGKNFSAQQGLNLASVLFGGYAVGSVITRLAIRPAINLLGAAALIPIGFTGFFLGYLVLAVAGGYFTMGISGVLCGLSHGLMAPSLTARLLELQRHDEMGRVTILMQGFWGGGAGLFPYLGGFVLELVSFRTLYLLMAGLFIVGILINIYVGRIAPQQIARIRAMSTPGAVAPAAAGFASAAAPAVTAAASAGLPGRTGITRVVVLRRPRGVS